MKERMKGLWKDIKWVFNYMASIVLYAIIVILLLIGFVFVSYIVDSKKNEINGEHKAPLYGAYVIVSQSMHPAIKVGDAIIVKRVDESELEVGDVITYKGTDVHMKDLMITHRINRIEEKDGDTYYVMKGDYNTTCDPTPIVYENIYGKVIIRIPKVGYLQSFLSTHIGWLVIIVLPCLLIVGCDVAKLVRTIKERNRLNKRKNGVTNNEEK